MGNLRLAEGILYPTSIKRITFLSPGRRFEAVWQHGACDQDVFSVTQLTWVSNVKDLQAVSQPLCDTTHGTSTV